MREARWHGSAEERGRNGRWEMRRALRNAAAVPSGKQSNVNKSGVPAGRLDTVVSCRFWCASPPPRRRRRRRSSRYARGEQPACQEGGVVLGDRAPVPSFPGDGE